MKSAQISLEYLMVITFSLLLLIPGLYLMMDYTRQSSNEIIGYQINQIGNLLVNAAETVDGYGKDTRVVVQFEFPDRISNMQIVNNSILYIDLLYLGRNSSFPFFSEVNITGSFAPSDYSPGRKEFRVESKGDHVLIQRI